ncbi:ComF family protein, partial [Bacteroidota bacterium]
MVIPVPLHPKKEKARGYNQSFSIAQSISDILDIQCVSDNLFRTTESSTQTKKSRYERFENVNSIFKLKNPGQLSKENILLVDDVITTGSTLEACAECILEVDGTTVSVAALAVA